MKWFFEVLVDYSCMLLYCLKRKKCPFGPFILVTEKSPLFE